LSPRELVAAKWTLDRSGQGRAMRILGMDVVLAAARMRAG